MKFQLSKVCLSPKVPSRSPKPPGRGVLLQGGLVQSMWLVCSCKEVVTCLCLIYLNTTNGCPTDYPTLLLWISIEHPFEGSGCQIVPLCFTALPERPAPLGCEGKQDCNPTCNWCRTPRLNTPKILVTLCCFLLICAMAMLSTTQTP